MPRGATEADPLTPQPIVFVSSGLSISGGGTAVVSRLLWESLVEFTSTRSLGLEVYALDESEESSRHNARLFRSKATLALHLITRQLASTPQALVFDHLGPARTQAFLPPNLRQPYLVFLHGIEVWKPLRWSSRRALTSASIRVANSAYTRDRLTRDSGLSPELTGPIDVVPLATERRQLVGQIDTSLLTSAGSGFFLTVGRMSASERYKGHDHLLEAMSLLARSDKKPRLVVCGSGEDSQRLQVKADDLGVSDRILFTGFVSEPTLRELYRRCAVFALPSRDEGFGIVYLEAMAAAKPCIACSGGAAEEIVVNGETGVLVPYGDAERLARALATFLRDTELAANMGAAGRSRWQRQFTAPRFSQDMQRHFSRLLENRDVRH